MNKIRRQMHFAKNIWEQLKEKSRNKCLQPKSALIEKKKKFLVLESFKTMDDTKIFYK